MKFAEWIMNENKQDDEGWRIFLNVIKNPNDEDSILVLLDWLEENGFPKVALNVRYRLGKKGELGYFTTEELVPLGVSFNSSILQKYKIHNAFVWETPAKYHFIFRTRPSGTIQSYDTSSREWVNIPQDDPPEEIKKLMPAFVLLLNFSNQGGTYHDRRFGGFLGNLSVELTNINQIIHSANNVGHSLSYKVRREITNICQEIQLTVKQLPPNLKTLNIILDSLHNYLDRTHQLITENGVANTLLKIITDTITIINAYER
jgi:hypothetical protein